MGARCDTEVIVIQFSIVRCEVRTAFPRQISNGNHMTKDATERISAQAVGAFGESATEAELLRRGWIPANVNATVNNAADFDIFAQKGGSLVKLRVKTCGPNSKGFQFGGLRSVGSPGGRDVVGPDFTVLVRMESRREDDRFYIVPTNVVRQEIAARQRDYLATRKRDGGERKDTGHWALFFDKRKDGRDEGGWGLASKWERYLGAWALLDEHSKKGRGAARYSRAVSGNTNTTPGERDRS